MADNQDDEYLHIAANALKEIKSGNATAFAPYKYALYGRVLVEKWFELLARLYTSSLPAAVILFAAVLVVYGAFCAGFVRADAEDELNELFVNVESRKDLDYTESFLSGEIGSLEIVLQYRPATRDLNKTNFTQSLLEHVDVVRSVIDLPVRYKGRVYTFYDLCTYGPFPPTTMPDFDRIMNALHVCVMFTVLDCFWEGSFLQNPPSTVVVERPSYCPHMPQFLTWSNFNYQEFIDCLADNANVSGYDPNIIQGLSNLRFDGYLDKPCFSYHQDCPSEVIEPHSNLFREAGVCDGATAASVTPYQLVTGYELADPDTDSLRTFRTNLLLGGTDSVQNNLRSNGIDLTQGDVIGLLNEWKDRMYDHVVDYDEGRVKAYRERPSNDRLYGFTSNFFDNLAEELSVAVPALLITGYVLMIIYCALAFLKFDLVQSRMSAGLVGVFIVILGTAAALGITAAAGVSFSLLTVQVYPFLILGLGVDDMFVIVGTFVEIEKKKGRDAPIKELIKDTMVAVGPSITLTSVTNFAGFLLAYTIPIPIFRFFVIEVAVAIAFNYIGLVIAMPCFLVFDYYRSHGKLMDVLCCIPVWWHSDKDAVANAHVSDKKDASEVGCITYTYRWLSEASREYYSIITMLVAKFYSPFLQNFIVKIFAVIGFFILLAFGIWGCTRITFFARGSDFGIDGSPYIEYADINDAYYISFPFAIVTKSFNYSGLQPQLLEMDQRIRDVDNVLAPSASNGYWIREMIGFYQNLYSSACVFPVGPELKLPAQGLMTGIISVADPSYFANARCDPTTNETCLCSYNLVIIDSYNGENYTIIPPANFYYYLTFWSTLDGVTYGLLGAFLNPAPPQFDPTDFSTVVPASLLLYAQTNFYVFGLAGDTAGIDHIHTINIILDSYIEYGIDAYNLGETAINFATVIGIKERILSASGFIVIACFVTTTLFLMDLHSGVLMGAIVIVNAVEVAGYLAHFRIPLDNFASVVYLAGIAIGVEFTAPLAFYFLKATSDGGEYKSSGWWILKEYGSRNERMHKALVNRFTPIFNGAVTTFIGVMMIYFVPLQFIRSYFIILMIVIVVGLLNGLVFLPVLLSLIGPFAQVQPTFTGTDPSKGVGTTNPLTEEEVEDDEKKKALEASTTFMY